MRVLEPVPAVIGEMQGISWTGCPSVTGLTQRVTDNHSHSHSKNLMYCKINEPSPLIELCEDSQIIFCFFEVKIHYKTSFVTRTFFNEQPFKEPSCIKDVPHCIFTGRSCYVRSKACKIHNPYPSVN